MSPRRFPAVNKRPVDHMHVLLLHSAFFTGHWLLHKGSADPSGARDSQTESVTDSAVPVEQLQQALQQQVVRQPCLADQHASLSAPLAGFAHR
jgi:hypothetical protein